MFACFVHAEVAVWVLDAGAVQPELDDKVGAVELSAVIEPAGHALQDVLYCLWRRVRAQPQRDGTIFAIVTPPDLDVINVHPRVLRRQLDNVLHKWTLVVANHLDIQVARILLYVLEGSCAINVRHVTSHTSKSAPAAVDVLARLETADGVRAQVQLRRCNGKAVGQ